MKRMHPESLIPHFLALAAALAMAGSSKATPYATSLTNNAGMVSFRLNQTTAPSDTVLVISSGGAVTNTLQAPSADPANIIPRGLVITNLGIAAGPFKVYIKHIGNGQISTNSPRVAFNSMRGIAVNTRPASPQFGWVYVGNSAAGTKGDGIFAFSSDLSDPLNQSTNAKTGGYNFGAGGASAPYHVSIAPDDTVLVTDWSDASGNVIAMDPLLDTFTFVLKQYTGTAASPVGANNNHGSISSAFIVGTGAGRVLYTMDEDYQTDPVTGVAREWNSVWRYDIGNDPFPWTSAPNRKIMSPYLTTFAGQNQKVEVVGRYLYANQRRANPPQHSAYIVDLNNLMDPATFSGATPWGMHWTSQEASLAAGYSDDVLRDTMTTAVSPDGKWYAAIIAAGTSATAITAPDGSTFGNSPNDVLVMPITNGIPNIPAMQRFRQGGASLGRDLAFDAAHNLYVGSSGLQAVQSLDIGESTEAITGSDGTFNLSSPATQVTVAATVAQALEQGTTPGAFTFTRSPDDIDNPVTVFYTLAGSATNGVDYAMLTNQITIPAGKTTASIFLTPVDDSITEPTETLVLTIRGGGGYTVGFPLSATISIVDNETPQLQIVSLSTNIYQGNLNDYATLRLRRLGQIDTPVTVQSSDFAFSGTAVPNVDYRVANLPITIPAGVVDYSVNILFPLDASIEAGSKSIVLTLQPGTGYTVTNNVATNYLTLKAVQAGKVLFSDDFESDPNGSNWDVRFATIAGGAPDYIVIVGYDYASGSVGNLSPIPPAPHSANGATRGLYLTVNKGDDTPASAALNLYLKNRVFSGDYSLRFDMFLVQNSAGTQQSKNETALFGINLSGTRTNWIRNSIGGTGAGTNKFDSDGIWCTVDADASTTIDFGFWSGPTYTNGAAVVGPTNFLARQSATTTQIFKRPPFDAGPAAGGVPANTVVNPTPTWVAVEISQVGKTVTWKMNNTLIFSYLNTNVNTAAYSQGTIMLGYGDPWDDIGNSSANSGEACVIFDNVQVVSLLSAPTVTAKLAGANLDLTFTTQAGFSYVVEYTSALGSGVWTTLSTHSGTGSPITYTTQTVFETRRFFRVRFE